MRKTTAATAVLCVLLAATASLDIAYAFPYPWGEYYYRDAALYGRARLQQQCPVNQASSGCKTARLTADDGSNAFVHVCPNSGNVQQPICYNSNLRRCCRSNVERDAFTCVSATKVTVGGRQVTIGIYKHPDAGHCVYFDSDVDVRSCCNPGDKELPCVCVPKRDIYFVLDTTQSIGTNIFCTFGYVIQLIEAAINPSGGSQGARVSTILFEYEFSSTKTFGATHLFQLSDSCNTAVNTNIPRVVYEYDFVAKKQEKKLSYSTDDLSYPQVGAKNTRPYSALSLAHADIRANSQNRPATVIVLTDGKPDQTLTSIVNRLKRVTVDLIAAGIGSSKDISEENLQDLASSKQDVVYESDLNNVVSFARRIVERMRDTAALCSDQATKILKALESTKEADIIEKYCKPCLWKSPDDSTRDCKGGGSIPQPTCDASAAFFSVDNSNSKSSTNEELERLMLEERILNEVEEMMEMDEERREYQTVQEEFAHLTAV